MTLFGPTRKVFPLHLLFSGHLAFGEEEGCPEMAAEPREKAAAAVAGDPSCHPRRRDNCRASWLPVRKSILFSLACSALFQTGVAEAGSETATSSATATGQAKLMSFNGEFFFFVAPERNRGESERGTRAAGELPILEIRNDPCAKFTAAPVLPTRWHSTKSPIWGRGSPRSRSDPLLAILSTKDPGVHAQGGAVNSFYLPRLFPPERELSQLVTVALAYSSTDGVRQSSHDGDGKPFVKSINEEVNSSGNN